MDSEIWQIRIVDIIIKKRPNRKGQHFADSIFKEFFLTKLIVVKKYLTDITDNKPALVRVKAFWRKEMSIWLIL